MIVGQHSLNQDIYYKAKVSVHSDASAVIFNGVWLNVYGYTAGSHTPTDFVLGHIYLDLEER